MKAMILAAGRGERMRPLTDTCPKPLLKVAGIPLIEHHIRNLVNAGITDIIINLAWLGEKISDHLGDGCKFGANITYSHEVSGALETAGGIAKALPLLTEDPEQYFLVVNGDIYCDYDFSCLPRLADDALAHICLISNPSHNLNGDFLLLNNEVANLSSSELDNTNTEPLVENCYTFSGIGLYRPSFFSQATREEVAPLGPMLRKAAAKHKLAGSLLNCRWVDVGTPQRLTQLNQLLEGNK